MQHDCFHLILLEFCVLLIYSTSAVSQATGFSCSLLSLVNHCIFLLFFFSTLLSAMLIPCFHSISACTGSRLTTPRRTLSSLVMSLALGLKFTENMTSRLVNDAVNVIFSCNCIQCS